MKRSVSLVSIALLTFAGAVAHAETVNPPPATAAPVVVPNPPAPAAAPVVVAKPVMVEKDKPTPVPAPASPPMGTPEPTHSGDMPPAREAKTLAGQAISPDGLAGYVWPVISFAMLIAGFAAGYFWRHQVSRQKLGGMSVRIGTWRGTP